MKKISLTLTLCTLSSLAIAQSQIYPQHFDLQEVTLSESPLKEAMDLNIQTLLAYDVDRLLTPFVRQAQPSGSAYTNWTTKHPNFDNWGSGSFRLDGHVGGHYLSALALAYAACHDTETQAKLKERMEYMVQVLKDCQNVFDSNTNGLYGYIGGYPDNSLWTDMYSGSTSKFKSASGNVPLYVQHKVLAGLRDAYIYGKIEIAREMLIKLADWSVNLVAKYSTSTMQDVLNTEHGGMNEVLADVYLLTGDQKYLTAAKKYSHTTMIDGMQSVSTNFLDNRHANTQVPKYIGFERVAQLDNSMTRYDKAAQNFWTDVVSHRTVCIGGNSMNEWFMASSAAQRYVDEGNGPESCNTNNMLKLSESLFDATHQGKYADFYESAMYNHILSTIDPKTGGYVYFTPLRPQSYRIYSKVNQDMWCCVGTGMENHSKYGHFIYTHQGKDILYVNLFVPSTLSSETFSLSQNTSFPYEPKTQLTLQTTGTYTIAIRKPNWVGEGYSIQVNGAEAQSELVDGYCKVTREWNAGDVITVNLPMQLHYEQCPNLKDYIAFRYGPILLGARTTSTDPKDAHYEALSHEYAAGERMGHAPDSYTSKKPLSTAPLLIGNRNEVLSHIHADNTQPLHFHIQVSRNGDSLQLAPYYTLHHSRVMNYWYQATESDYANSSWAQAEREAAELDDRTIEYIRTGEQQSEAGVVTYSDDSSVGTFRDEVYRDNKAGGWSQYVLANSEGAKEQLGIIARFQTADAGRKADIFIDGQLVDSYTISTDFSTVDGNGFYNKEWAIPQALLLNPDGSAKASFTLRIEANHNTFGPGVYFVRLTKRCRVADLTAPGTDVTSTYIKNPSFEANGNSSNVASTIPNNWSLNNTSLGWYGINVRNNNDDNPTDGTHVFGVWNGSSVPVDLTQKVMLPSGKYTLTVDMHCSNRTSTVRLGNQRVYAKVDPTDGEGGIGYFKDQRIPGTGDNYPMQTIATTFVVNANEGITLPVTIGVGTSEAPAETWFKIDNFRLYHKPIVNPTGIDASNIQKPCEARIVIDDRHQMHILTADGTSYSIAGQKEKSINF